MSFGENFAAQGFMPSLTLGAEAMLDTVRTVLRSSDDAASAKKNVGSVMKDFSAFTMEMIDGLPEVAFKQMSALEGIQIAKQDRPNPAKSPVGGAQSSTGADARTMSGVQVCAVGSAWNTSLGRCVPTQLSEQIDEFLAKCEGLEADQVPEEFMPVVKEDDEETAKKDEGGSDYVADTDPDDGEAEELPEAAVAKDEDPTDTLEEVTADDYDWDDPDYKRALAEVESIKKSGSQAMDLGSILTPMPPRKKKASEEEAEEEKTETTLKDEGGDGEGGKTADADGGESGEDKILKAIEGLTEEVKEARKETQALGQRVDEVEGKTRKAEEAVHGTVLSGAAIQDNTFGTRNQDSVKKSDDDVWAGSALDRLVG
jgi:hypothetical protein